MFHDLIILAILSLVAYVAALMVYAISHPYRFRDKKEWWKSEGIILFMLIFVGFLLLALAGKVFHSLQ